MQRTMNKGNQLLMLGQGLLSSKTPPDQGFRAANEQDGRKASASESLAFEVSMKFFLEILPLKVYPAVIQV